MAAMKIVFVALAFVCLVQGHSVERRQTSFQTALNNALANVQKLANDVNAKVMEGSAVLDQYRDKSTDYASVFRVNSLFEINNLIKGYNVACTNAQALAKTANGSVIQCFTLKNAEVSALAINIATELAKCAVTKVAQFKDLALKIDANGKAAVALVPTTISKLQACQTAALFFREICVGTCSTDAAVKMTSYGVGIASAITQATALYGTLVPDLELCAAAKLFSFRQKMYELTLTVGSCVIRTVA